MKNMRHFRAVGCFNRSTLTVNPGRWHSKAGWVGIAALASMLQIPLNLSAATYTYTPQATTDTWTAGTNWSSTPVSGSTTQLVFGPTGTQPTVGTSTTINDISGNFQLNTLNLEGVSATSSTAVVVNINNTSPSTGLEFVSNGAQTPVVNMDAAKGGGGGNVTFNVNSAVKLTNNTLFTTTNSNGNATGAFNFNGAITGSGSLTKTAGNILALNADNSGYTGNIILSGLKGYAVVQNGSAIGLRTNTSILTGSPFGTGSISTDGASILTIAPTGTVGAVALTIGSGVAGNAFNYGGATQLNLNLGASATSLSVTLGSSGNVLNRVGDGVLLLQGLNSGSSNVLGSSVKIFVNGTPPALNPTNLSVNQSIVSYNGAAGTGANTGDFLTYGANGFVADTAKYTNHATSFTSANAEIANITAAATMTDGGAGSHAAALRINGVTLTLNGTVNLGDGTNPAGVIINGGTGAAFNTLAGGTLAFGSSEGIIYQFGTSAATGTARTITSNITGTNGLTLVNDVGNTTTIDLASTISTGSVHFTMGNINIATGADLSADVISVSSGAVVSQTASAISVLGLNDPAVGNGGRYTTNANSLTFTGSGTYSSSASLVTSNLASINMTGSGTQTLSGVVGGGTATVTVAANGGTLVLSGNDTYTGATSVNLGTLVLQNNGTTGSLAGTAVTVGSGVTPVAGVSGNGTVQVKGNYSAGGSWNIKGGNTTGTLIGQGTLSTVDTTANTLTLTKSAADALIIGSLNTGNTAVLNMEIGTISDKIAVTGAAATTLILSGTTAGATPNLVNLTSLGGLNGTTQTLISTTALDTTSTGHSTFAQGFALGTTSGNFGGYTVALGSTATSLTLTETANAAPTVAYWKGTNADGLWNSFTGGNTNTSNFVNGLAGTNDNGLVGATSDVTFNATGATNFANTALGQDFTIKSLSFNTTGVGIGGTNTLTIGNSAGITVATGAGAGTNTISSKVALGTNQTWTVTDANSTLAVSGVISGTGTGLTKAGLGTLVLSGINTYNGATAINGGTVKLTGSNSSSATAVNSPGTLTGTGTAGGMTLNSGGTIAPGVGSGDTIGVLQASSLTWNTNLAASTLSFNLDGNSTSSTKLTLTGAFTQGATGNLFNINLTDSSALTTVGSYVLVDFGSTNFTSASQLNLLSSLTFAPGYTGSLFLDTVNHQLDFNVVAVVPEPGTWALMLGGLGLLVAIQRRRQQHS